MANIFDDWRDNDEPTFTGAPPPASNPTPWLPRYESEYNRIADAYKTYTGREGSPEEIWGIHMRQGSFTLPENVHLAIENIRNSPEAAAYLARNAAQPGSGTTPSTQNPSGGGNTGGGSTPAFDTSLLFDDPATKGFQDLINAFVTKLGQPLNIQGLDQYVNLLGTRINQLGQPYDIPELTAYKEQLSRGAPQNAELERALAYAAQRMTELQQPPFTALQEKGQEVAAFDQLERDKQAARQQVAERLAARGVGAGSGILEAAVQQSDRTFDALKAKNLNELLMYRTSEGERRKGEALEVGTLAANLRQAQLDQDLDIAQQLAAVAQSQTALNESRLDQLTNLGSVLANLGFTLDDLTTTRGLQQLSVAALLPDLVQQRLQMALATLNGGTVSTTPLSGMIGNLLQQSGWNRANAPTNDTSGLFSSIGGLLGLLPTLLGGGSGGGGGSGWGTSQR